MGYTKKKNINKYLPPNKATEQKDGTLQVLCQCASIILWTIDVAIRNIADHVIQKCYHLHSYII